MMNNRNPQITITEPCTQKWEEMDKKDGFNFCQACNKCVVDFTSYSNAEIISILANSASEVCGRLTQEQLDQLNYHLVVAPTNRNWMKYLGVLAIGVSIFAPNVHANSFEVKSNSVVSKSINQPADAKKPLKVKSISGRVLDSNNRPLAKVKVVVLNTKYYALTDKNGHYEIAFTNGIDFENNILAVESAQFTGHLKINYAGIKQADLRLNIKPMIMGKICIPKKELRVK